MKTFNDAAGRTWTIALTLGTAMHVKNKLAIDLLQPEAGEPPLLTRLGTDEMLLGEVLCALLESQFVVHNVTDADVRNAFYGKTLLAAQKAFYDELTVFFQSRGRMDRAKAVVAQAALIEKATAAVETKIDTTDLDRLVARALSRKWPEPSASTTETRRCVSCFGWPRAGPKTPGSIHRRFWLLSPTSTVTRKRPKPLNHRSLIQC